MTRGRMRVARSAAWLCALLSGCDLAPPYRPPSPILPAQYQASRPFVVARPQDQFARGRWWRMFGDAVLDRLEQQLDAENPDLQAAQEP